MWRAWSCCQSNRQRWISLTKDQQCVALVCDILLARRSCWTNNRVTAWLEMPWCLCDIVHVSRFSRPQQDWRPHDAFHFEIGHVRTRRAIQREYTHDDVIKWKHFPRYWPFVRGFRRSPVNSPHKGQWRGALTFSLIYARTNSWANSRDAGVLRRHRAYYDVTVMFSCISDHRLRYCPNQPKI